VPADFTQRCQVRYDECAPDGTARAAALLRYVVETAFGHSTRLGFPLAWYEARGQYWVVRRANLDLRRPLPYGLPIDITTEVVGFRRIWARRRNTVRDAGGAVLAIVTMDWFFTDREGSPARVPAEMVAAFPAFVDPLEVERLGLGDPPTDARTGEYVVPAHQTDPRGHMNSAAYLDVFEDELAAAGVDPQKRPAICAVEYLRAALPAEALRLLVWRRTDGYAMLAATAEGTPVARGRWRS
jgi:acyl-CoA thioesterase FadM